jgi:hypothetical protein
MHPQVPQIRIKAVKASWCSPSGPGAQHGEQYRPCTGEAGRLMGCEESSHEADPPGLLFNNCYRDYAIMEPEQGQTSGVAAGTADAKEAGFAARPARNRRITLSGVTYAGALGGILVRRSSVRANEIHRRLDTRGAQ